MGRRRKVLQACGLLVVAAGVWLATGILPETLQSSGSRAGPTIPAHPPAPGTEPSSAPQVRPSLEPQVRPSLAPEVRPSLAPAAKRADPGLPATLPASRDEPRRAPPEVERWLLATMLAGALAEPLPETDRVRLAELLLEARDLRGHEAPGRERDILLALNADFERIAGEPMGNVASRLSLPGEVPAQPPPQRRPGEIGDAEAGR